MRVTCPSPNQSIRLKYQQVSNYFKDLLAQSQKLDLKDLQEHLDPKDLQGLQAQLAQLAPKDLQERLDPKELQD